MFNILRSFSDTKVFLKILPNLVVIVTLVVIATLGITSSVCAQTIFFDPTNTIPTDPNFDVVIDIDCGLELVKGIELFVTYDPLLVQLNGISAGAWFTGSSQSYYFYDYTNNDPPGTIHFASAVLDGTLGGSDVLAVCHFSILGLGISPLVFQDVDVRDAANLQLTFGNSIGDNIIIDPAVNEAEYNFGTMKAIYR